MGTTTDWLKIVVRGLAGGLLMAVLFALPSSAQLKKGSRFQKGGRCVECHQQVSASVAVGHAPLVEGDCATCHKPHGLVGALRLQSDEPDLCYQCHEAIGLGVEAAHVHAEVQNCSTCHNPHGSDHKAILRAPQKELCQQCHR